VGDGARGNRKGRGIALSGFPSPPFFEDEDEDEDEDDSKTALAFPYRKS